MGERHIADGESAFLVANIPPDFCQVGDSVIPFDIVRTLDHELSYVKSVYARGERVLALDSVVQGVDGDAGRGVISGTSLGSGDCEVIQGSSTVRAEGKCVARHFDLVLMNDGNCLGRLYTLEKAPEVVAGGEAPPPVNPPEVPEEEKGYWERSLEVLEGYADGVGDTLVETAKLSGEGLKNLVTNPVETIKALGWGAKELGSLVVEGWGNILSDPGEVGKAFVWAGKQGASSFVDVLQNGSLREAGHTAGAVVTNLAFLAPVRGVIGRAGQDARLMLSAGEAKALMEAKALAEANAVREAALLKNAEEMAKARQVMEATKAKALSEMSEADKVKLGIKDGEVKGAEGANPGGGTHVKPRGPLYDDPSGFVKERVNQLQAQIPENSKGRITMSAAVVEDQNGVRSVLIGTSEPRGYLRPSVELLDGERIVAGTGHAEADIVSFANKNGLKVVDIGATRPVCTSCQDVIVPTGAHVSTPLKPR